MSEAGPSGSRTTPAVPPERRSSRKGKEREVLPGGTAEGGGSEATAPEGEDAGEDTPESESPRKRRR